MMFNYIRSPLILLFNLKKIITFQLNFITIHICNKYTLLFYTCIYNLSIYIKSNWVINKLMS